MLQPPEFFQNYNEEDAYAFLAKLLFDCFKLDRRMEQAQHGFDVYIPKVVDVFLKVNGTHDSISALQAPLKQNIYRAFFNAAWQMCLRGLLRPSSADHPYEHHRAIGDGYSFTERGLKWFSKGDVDSIILSTSRMDQLLGGFVGRYGDGYAERVHQAVLCHSARAFLACCAMCGAAAESILLAIAIEKEKDEAGILVKYKAQSGRRTIEKIIFDGKKDGFVAQFKSGLELLKHWRDESAHGTATGYDDVEATVALNHLLRFAQHVDEKWAELTT